ncbi:MAG: malate synthase G [Rhodobacteraceae bacterium]|nr:malate synthase G [Paracoccaceae bacterium]
MNRVERFGLQVDARFAAFMESEALPGTGIGADRFWETLSAVTHEMGPENAELLRRRSGIQSRIDAWHVDRRGEAFDPAAYRGMLEEIGYLVPEGPDFQVTTDRIDAEIASIAGPQLVVPITNARFALNAANARWNSLYDALYGTDAIDGEMPPAGGYDRERGRRVVEWAKTFLDEVFPLASGSHAGAGHYCIEAGILKVVPVDGQATGLRHPEQFIGYRGDLPDPSAVLLKNNGLHLEIHFDRGHPVGKTDPAGVADILMEAAITTIMDCEDSVAVVDAEDKTLAYGNWLGLMKGDLQAQVTKGDRSFTRKLEADRRYLDSKSRHFTLKRGSLLLVRNVGHLMRCPVVLDSAGNEIFEGLLDAVCTIVIALHDVNGARRNSAEGSIYVVKPKLHGPEEAAFTDRLFQRVESAFGLAANSVKIGIMDEERRTTVNLKECIRAASARVAFINTGFLDRTGDEIHTSMEAGPFLRKADIKQEDWIAAYEDWNVDIGIACGLPGRAQIGKGMWAMPDLMRAMLEQKAAHPQSGANTAWVPSPTAATLHAIHYHRVSVAERQRELMSAPRNTGLDRILNIPLSAGRNWSEAEIIEEVENNLQGILGYVVRWVDQGIGCSKVPDISNVQLMEDRATCRISSQHVANWLHHGVVDRETVEQALRRMARIVDDQNSTDPNYVPMAPGFDGYAFRAASELVFEGRRQPSGYTEPLLHHYRAKAKVSAAG